MLEMPTLFSFDEFSMAALTAPGSIVGAQPAAAAAAGSEPVV